MWGGVYNWVNGRQSTPHRASSDYLSSGLRKAQLPQGAQPSDAIAPNAEAQRPECRPSCTQRSALQAWCPLSSQHLEPAQPALHPDVLASS